MKGTPTDAAKDPFSLLVQADFDSAGVMVSVQPFASDILQGRQDDWGEKASFEGVDPQVVLNDSRVTYLVDIVMAHAPEAPWGRGRTSYGLSFSCYASPVGLRFRWGKY